jgi:hypothetical protein
MNWITTTATDCNEDMTRAWKRKRKRNRTIKEKRKLEDSEDRISVEKIFSSLVKTGYIR